MLFLAVFCGFLAENIREHKVEKKREKQFIQSLVNDIQADIDQLEILINKRDQKQVAVDSTIKLLNSPHQQIQGSSLYYNAIHTARRADVAFVPNDGTFLQLKNAGGLRLIGNRRVVDSIMNYDIAVRNLVTHGESEQSLVDNYRVVSSRIFDPSVFDSMLDQNNVSTRPGGNPQLLIHDKAAMVDLLGSLYYLKVINKSLRRDFTKLKLQATSVIKTIKEEYHLPERSMTPSEK